MPVVGEIDFAHSSRASPLPTGAPAKCDRKGSVWHGDGRCMLHVLRRAGRPRPRRRRDRGIHVRPLPANRQTGQWPQTATHPHGGSRVRAPRRKAWRPVLAPMFYYLVYRRGWACQRWRANNTHLGSLTQRLSGASANAGLHLRGNRGGLKATASLAGEAPRPKEQGLRSGATLPDAPLSGAATNTPSIYGWT